MSDEQPGLNQDHNSDPLLGKILQDRYKIEKKLGQGGMGAVYLAEHILIQKKVAIKCLHAGLASNPDVVRRFQNEAVAATAIGHANIVDVTDMGRFDDGTFFMVLEFLQGKDWQELLDKGGAQPLAQVAHIGVQICDALQAACVTGIVHRDLKPENIFLIERRGDPHFVKILDFGISKFRAGIGGGTQTGALMGTPYYMAPEQISGAKDVSHLADIYATGIIFFQALTGTLPFSAATLPELIMKIATSPTPALSEHLPNAPEQLCSLIESMLSKEPKDRPQSFAEVGVKLEEYLAPSSIYRTSRIPETHAEFLATQVPEGMQGFAPVIPRPTDIALEAPALPSLIGGTPDNFAATHQAQSIDTAISANTNEEAALAAENEESLTANAQENLEALTTNPKPQANAAATKWLSLAGGAALLLTLGGLAIFRTPTSTSSPTLQAAPGSVRLKVATNPRSALLRLNGELVDNPYDWEYPISGREMVFTTELPGYLQEKLVLNLQQSVYKNLRLRRDPRQPLEEKSPETSTKKEVPRKATSATRRKKTEAPKPLLAKPALTPPPKAAPPKAAPPKAAPPKATTKSEKDNIESPF